jgi:DNA repair exonuclease SbcCD ATPase subunit
MLRAVPWEQPAGEGREPAAAHRTNASNDEVTLAQWLLHSLEISGGFLADLSLRFPPGLVCIIGPRGSGKSTFAEALRIGVGGIPAGLPKPRLDFLKANLGSAVVTITTAGGTERGTYTIRRTYSQPPVLTTSDGRPVTAVELDRGTFLPLDAYVLTTSDGRPVTAVELDRGTFLPLDAYSSLEIEGIADESLGAKRRSLLDELCPVEMQQISLALSNQRRALEANADAIQAVQRRIADLTEHIEELGDARGRLETLPPVNTQAASPEFQAASQQRQLNEREATGLRQAVEATVQFRTDLEGVLANARSRLSASVVIARSANETLLARADSAIAAMWPAVEKAVKEAARAAADTETELQALQGDLARISHRGACAMAPELA